MSGNEQKKPKRRWRPIRRFLGFFGIRYPKEKGQWLLLTGRFRIIVVSLIVLALAAFAAFMLYFSGTPGFCNSCHIMKPYVASWRSSTHNKVPCAKCHFPPGWTNVVRGKIASTTHLIKTLTNTQGVRPSAEIEDAACLREGCHETRLLKGKVLFKGKYNFNHTTHLTKLRRGKKLRCTSCHSQIVQGSHISVTESVCFTCHFKGQVHDRVMEPIAGCTSCHEAPPKPFKTTRGLTFDHKPLLDRKVACWNCHLDAVQGTGSVPRQVCLTCHGEPAKLKKYSDSTLIHDWHVTKRKVECYQCHSEIRHGLRPKPPARQATCETCHSSGHKAHASMYSGTGGRGVSGEPSRHFMDNVGCVACHEAAVFKHGRRGEDITSLEATEAACVKCHGDRIKGTLGEWKDVVAEMLAEAKVKLAEARKACEALPKDDPRRPKAWELLEAARYNYDFVEKASGVHNPGYAMELLEKVTEDAAEALRTAAKGGAETETP